LRIVDAGQVVMALPGPSGEPGTGSPTSQTVTFDTSTTWTVPAGVAFVEFTCVGGSGGGGGGARAENYPWGPAEYAHGGNGGTSGKAITTREVVEGEVYVLTVGANGVGGATAVTTLTGPITGAAGTNGGATTVMLSGTVICRGDGGGGGTGGTASTFPSYYRIHGVTGTNGSGFGITVYPGAGTGGGGYGVGSPVRNGQPGTRGYITVRY